jgi:hypothetical protein
MSNRKHKPDYDITFDALESIYFDTITPIAEKMRDVGIDWLQVNWESETESYWEPCEDYAEMTVQR